MLDVSNWDKVYKGATSKFQLVDKNGNEVHRAAKEGDCFKIDIPAPGTKTGDDYDWVHIASVSDHSDSESESVSIKARPAKSPQNNQSETAHFFSEEATSTFIVNREGKTVRAEVHGRNELPNTGVEGVLDTVCNALVGIGAILGFSKPQWENLVEGLLATNSDN